MTKVKAGKRQGTRQMDLLVRRPQYEAFFYGRLSVGQIEIIEGFLRGQIEICPITLKSAPSY